MAAKKSNSPTPARIRDFSFQRRAAGVLLHPTSLPGPHGSGDLGPAAFRFVDFLKAAGQSWWQMLPTGPAHPMGSPYSSSSAFAGNPLLISLELLVDDGLLREIDLMPEHGLSDRRVNYPAMTRFRMAKLDRAHEKFLRGDARIRKGAVDRFFEAQRKWLEPFATFAACRALAGGKPWTVWDARTPQLRQHPDFLRHFGFQVFVQFLFDRQWTALKRHANAQGIGLIGDIPIFVDHDSADVWSHRDLWDLDRDGCAKTISGCPPDSFNRDGQLWGHPQYRWEAHRKTSFAWWIDRFRHMLSLLDGVRIDHFLGFARLWSVAAGAKNARRGKWVSTPGDALFAAMYRQLGPVEIIAEDLGVSTPAASALRDHYAMPGMRLLHFAFGEGAGARYNQPHRCPPCSVIYTGTHDNDTTVGWWRSILASERKQHRARTAKSDSISTESQRILSYAGGGGGEINWSMIRLAWLSPANTAITPVQDLLGLGSDARMNIPGPLTGNWQWRMLENALTPEITRRLLDLTGTYERLPAEK